MSGQFYYPKSASLGALTAAAALGIIYICKVIFDLYCAAGALLLAHAAADTAVFAHAVGNFAYSGRFAADIYFLALSANYYKRVRAGFCSQTAADTLVFIYLGYAVDDRYRAVWADLNAVAVA